MVFPDDSVVKNPPAKAGDSGLISGSGRSPGGGNSNPLQHAFWDNPIDRGAWRATVPGVSKSLQDWALMHRHTLTLLQAEKAVAPHSSTLAWKIPWTEEPGRLQSMGSWRVGHDFTFTFTFHFHALEKEMATHSSVLAWRIPGTGEPGGLLSMRSHRVGHDWSDLAAAPYPRSPRAHWLAET